MSASTVIHRSIVVHAHVGEQQSAVSVIARTSRGTGRRHERMIWRGPMEQPDVSDMGSILRAAARAVSEAADSL